MSNSERVFSSAASYRPNPEGLSYSYDYRQSTRESGLPLLPVFGLRADL